MGTVEALKERGLEFVEIPKSYYEELASKLANSAVKVSESVQKL